MFYDIVVGQECQYEIFVCYSFVLSIKAISLCFWFFLLLHFWDLKSSCSWDEMGLKVPIVARGFTGNALSDVENMLAGSASLLANCLKRNI